MKMIQSKLPSHPAIFNFWNICFDAVNFNIKTGNLIWEVIHHPWKTKKRKMSSFIFAILLLSIATYQVEAQANPGNYWTESFLNTSLLLLKWHFELLIFSFVSAAIVLVHYFTQAELLQQNIVAKLFNMSSFWSN